MSRARKELSEGPPHTQDCLKIHSFAEAGSNETCNLCKPTPVASICYDDPLPDRRAPQP